MPQQLNSTTESCSEYIDPSGVVNQAKSVDLDGSMNALGTFITSRLLGMIAPYRALISAPVIKELIRASESKMFIKGGYGEKWHQDFNGNVWPHFAEKEIKNWVKESPDSHTGDLRQVLILRDLFETDVSDRTTWQRLFEIYVRLFRVSDPPRTVKEAMELVKQNFSKTPENFFESSKILLNSGSINEDNTLTVSRVLETDARKTFEELANGLFSQRDGKVNFILQAPDKLKDLAFRESRTLNDALPKAPKLGKNINDVGDFTTEPLQVELRHVRLQYGTWVGLFAFKEVFPNFFIATQDKLLSVRGNIVSEGTGIATEATFMRIPAGSIGLQGLGMWLKPQVGDDTRKKLYEEAHPNLKTCDESEIILSALTERENKICENLKGIWQDKALDKKIPDALTPRLSDYYDKCDKSFKTSRADDTRWVFDLIKTLGDCQMVVRNDLIGLKQASKGILWKESVTI